MKTYFLLLLCCFWMAGAAEATPMLFTFEGEATYVADDFGFEENKSVAPGTPIKYQFIFDFQRLGYSVYGDGRTYSLISPTHFNFYIEYVNGALLDPKSSPVEVKPWSLVDNRQGVYAETNDIAGPNLTIVSLLSDIHNIGFHIYYDPRSFYVGQNGFYFTESISSFSPIHSGTYVTSVLVLTSIEKISEIPAPSSMGMFLCALGFTFFTAKNARNRKLEMIRAFCRFVNKPSNQKM